MDRVGVNADRCWHTARSGVLALSDHQREGWGGRRDLLTFTGETGSVLSRQGFDPFGAQVSGSSTGLGHRGSSGARTDTETGYVGTGASPYDPATAAYPTAGLAAPGASPYAGGAAGVEGATSPTDLRDHPEAPSSEEVR
ncbi:MAG: hypothetical protein U0R24_00850 [Solirubrobacterales bacterium]